MIYANLFDVFFNYFLICQSRIKSGYKMHAPDYNQQISYIGLLGFRVANKEKRQSFIEFGYGSFMLINNKRDSKKYSGILMFTNEWPLNNHILITASPLFSLSYSPKYEILVNNIIREQYEVRYANLGLMCGVGYKF